MWVGLLALVLGGGVIAAFAVMTPQTELHGTWNKSDQDVAIGGYDTVAYFTEGRPVKGDAGINYAWRDANWQCDSAWDIRSVDRRDVGAGAENISTIDARHIFLTILVLPRIVFKRRRASSEQ